MIGFAYQGCAPAGGYRLAEEQEEVAIPLFSNSFEAAWKKNTFVLGPGSSRRLGSFPMPGGDRGDGGFPLTVQATLMDSALVEAGIKEFAGLAGIDSTSFNAYRAIYLKRHSIDGCVLVYVDIQTFLAEDYLEADPLGFLRGRRTSEPGRADSDCAAPCSAASIPPRFTVRCGQPGRFETCEENP
jgi:hypothetical protein